MKGINATSLPPEAEFILCENMGNYDNKFWLYKPSHPNMTFGMSPMLNALIYIFTDKAVNGQSEALDVFRRSGLMELAEQESIFVAIPCPMNGNSWTEDDYAAYYNIQYILSGGHIEFHGPGTSPILQYTRYVYNNRQFVIGEGSGATFVNNVLTQNCNRIAAVCTFGGNMDAGLIFPADYDTYENSITITYYPEDAEEERIHYSEYSYGISAETKPSSEAVSHGRSFGITTSSEHTIAALTQLGIIGDGEQKLTMYEN